MSDDITELFNYIKGNSDFPETWAEGLRNPIFKTGLKIETCNYRGITVLPIFEKILRNSSTETSRMCEWSIQKNRSVQRGLLKGLTYNR